MKKSLIACICLSLLTNIDLVFGSSNQENPLNQTVSAGKRPNEDGDGDDRSPKRPRPSHVTPDTPTTPAPRFQTSPSTTPIVVPDAVIALVERHLTTPYNILDLSQCSVTNEILRGIVDYIRSKSIVTLFLNNNIIQSIGCKKLADFVAEDVHLVSLCLDGNNIQGAGAYNLTKALHSNNTLKILSISDNNMTIEGDEFVAGLCELLRANTGLEELYINGCNIAKDRLILIIEAMVENSNLLECKAYNRLENAACIYGRIRAILARNKLHKGKDSVKLLGLRDIEMDLIDHEALGHLSESRGIHFLNLSSNNPCLKRETIDPLCVILHNNPTIATIDLSGNSINDDGAIELSRQGVLKTVETFYIQDNPITERGVRALIDNAFHYNNAITQLKLHFANVSLKDQGSVNGILARNSMSRGLESIDLSNKYFDDDTLTTYLLSGIARSGMKSVNLTDNNITNDGIIRLLEAINIDSSTIEEITLINNNSINVDSSAMMRINGILARNRIRNVAKKLREADRGAILDGMKFNHESTPYIESALLDARNAIYKLSMKNCSLTAATLSTLMRGLNRSTSLKVLIVDNNPLGDVAVQDIEDLIKRNKVLSELYLNNVEIGIGAKPIFEALKTNETLRILEISNNDLNDGDTILASISDTRYIKWPVGVPQYNKNLRRLMVNGNPIDLQKLNEIAEVMRCCTRGTH